MHPRSSLNAWLLAGAMLLSALVADSATASPPGLPPNLEVQALLDSVSAEALGAIVQRLEAFTTRHTNSDTTSTTQGIGAARNWIYQRFDSLAGLPGSALHPGFFTFDSAICGRPGLHRNVFAVLPGASTPARHFLVSGHYDSRTRHHCDDSTFAPGANDDASGVAVAMEMARVLALHRLESSLILMAFTGEEQGLYGSTAYASWAAAQGMRIDGMINNDIVGNVTGCVIPSCPEGSELITDSMSVRNFSLGPSTSAHRQLARAMKLNGARYLPGFTVTLIPAHDRPGRGGDHFAFDIRGFPAVRFTEPNEFGDGSGRNGRAHNEHDTSDSVDVRYLARVARFDLAGIANLALAPETPASPTVLIAPGGALDVTWPSVPATADLAGYRIALRDTAAASLDYFDVRDAGLDPGPIQQHRVEGLEAGVPVYVSVSAYDAQGNESAFSAEMLATPLWVSVPPAPGAAAGRIRSVLPNPTTGEAEIVVDVGAPARVAIEVLEVTGRRIRVLAERRFEGGSSRLTWDGRDQAGRPARPGFYVVRMRIAGSVVDSRKITRLGS